MSIPPSITGPDATYLRQHVGDILAKGLAQTILRNPPDSVTYLATWLHSYVETQKREKIAADALSSQLVVDAKLAQQEITMEQEKQANKQMIESALATRKREFETFLKEADSYDGLFEGFVNLLNHEVGASSTYVAKLVDQDTLQYIATTKEAQFLIDQKLVRPQGVTFQLFDATEEESDDESIDEDDEEAVAARAAARAAKNAIPKHIHIPNVLLGPKSKHIHFHQLPGLGGYMAVRISYEAALNDETLDEAVEKEIEIENQRQEEAEEKKRQADEESETNTEDESEIDEDDDEISENERRKRREERERKKKEAEEPQKIETEEEKAARLAAEAEAKAVADEAYLVSQVTKQQVNYALCLDTLGQNRRFTPEQVQSILHYSSLLIQTMIRIDRRLFKEERVKRATLASYVPAERSEDEKQEEMDRISEERETQGKPIDEEDIAYVYRTQQLLSIQQLLLSLRTHHVFRGPLQVMQAAMYLLDIEKKAITNVDGQPEWKKIRALLTDDLFNKIREYEPRQPQVNGQEGSADPYATLKAISRLVKGLEYDEIREKNYAIAELFAWVMDAIAVKKKAAAQRKAEKEAARRAAEEQAEREAEEKERREAEAENEEGTEDDGTEATDSTEDTDNA